MIAVTDSELYEFVNVTVMKLQDVIVEKRIWSRTYCTKKEKEKKKERRCGKVYIFPYARLKPTSAAAGEVNESGVTCPSRIFGAFPYLSSCNLLW